MEVMLEKEDGKKQTNNEEKETVKEMLLLMRDWVFLMFAVSNFLTSLGYPIPYTFVPVRLKLPEIVLLNFPPISRIMRSSWVSILHREVSWWV